jgi:xylulokinase
MAAFLAAGLSLDWLAKCAGEFADRDLGVEPLLEKAGKTSAGSEGLCFLPHIAGERTPCLDPAARGAFWGITSTHNVGHFARAVLEGVAFSFRLGLEILTETGGPIRSITVGGGGAKSPLWRQIFADATNREVRAVTDIGETSLVGAAFAGARVLGWDAGAWLPKTVCVYRPERRDAETLETNYRQFLEAAPALRGIREASSGDAGR